MGNKLYVGNLSFDTIENDLQDLFAQAGSVTDCALMQDKMTGKSRGFAFVTMSSDDEAQKAISLFHGKDFHGRDLTVNEARPREDRTGGGPRRSFSGGGGENGGSAYHVQILDVAGLVDQRLQHYSALNLHLFGEQRIVRLYRAGNSLGNVLGKADLGVGALAGGCACRSSPL